MNSLNMFLQHPQKRFGINNRNNRQGKILCRGYKDKNEKHQVFQSEFTTYDNNISINEVESHLEATKKLTRTEKEEYFFALGLDYYRCNEYINIVKYLNRCFQKPYLETNKTIDAETNIDLNNQLEISNVFSIWGLFSILMIILYFSITNY